MASFLECLSSHISLNGEFKGCQYMSLKHLYKKKGAQTEREKCISSFFKSTLAFT